MSKIKSAFFCQSCGYEAAKWLGKCPSCSEWNTFVEEMIEKLSINTNKALEEKLEEMTDKLNDLQSRIDLLDE